MYPQGIASRSLRVGLLVTVVVLALSACGVGGGDEQANKPRPLPEEPQELRPGEYRSEEFKPPLSFRVGEGWISDLEISDALAIRQGEDVAGERALLGFATVREVYKPTKTGTITTEPAPEDMVGWYEQHPYLQTSKPELVTVGGVEGAQFDMVIEGLPEDYFGKCGSDCVDLFKLSSDHRHVIWEEEKQRAIVLEDVKGETVTLVFASVASEFDKLAPEAQKVIDSVEWRGS